MVDQAEELITVSPAPARSQFADLLRPALADSVEVVGTLRPEFLARVLNSPDLDDLPACWWSQGVAECPIQSIASTRRRSNSATLSLNR